MGSLQMMWNIKISFKACNFWTKVLSSWNKIPTIPTIAAILYNIKFLNSNEGKHGWKKKDKLNKSDDFQFQLFWYCFYIDSC